MRPDHRLFTAVALALTLLPAAAALHAQRPALGGSLKPDRIERRLFPPKLVMKHQEAIALDEDQRQALIHEVQQLQSDIVPLQFELSEAAEKLERLLSGPAIDEGRALAQADQVMGLEARVKKRHLTLLVRIKNLLTEEQQRKLEELRRPRW